MYLYFFPAFLPLASLIPIVLTMAGALAGGVQALRKKPRTALAIVVISTLIASVVFGISHFRNKRELANVPQNLTPENLPIQVTTRAWNQFLPRVPLSNLAYSSQFKLLVYGTEQKSLDAVSLEDGRLAFALQFAEPIISEPVIYEDRLYVGEGLHDAHDARLVAIQLPQGVALWQRKFQGHVESSPRYLNNKKTLIGCAGEAGIYSLRAQDGAPLWQKLLGHCDTTPWIEDRTVYALARINKQRSRLNALDVNDGQTHWTLDLPGDPWGTITRDPRTDYLIVTTGLGQLAPKLDAHEKGWLHAIDLKNKTVAWTVRLAGLPLLDGMLLNVKRKTLTIHTLKSGEILAFDTKNGSIQWNLKLSSPILSPPRLIPETNKLVAVAFDGSAYEIDATTGKTLLKFRIGSQSTSAPAFGPHWAFFADRAQLWALPMLNGTLQQ